MNTILMNPLIAKNRKNAIKKIVNCEKSKKVKKKSQKKSKYVNLTLVGDNPLKGIKEFHRNGRS